MLRAFDLLNFQFPKKKKKRGRKSKKTNFRNKYIGIAFFILGFIFLFTALNNSQNAKLDSSEPIVADKSFEKNKEESEVERIIIPKFNIDLKVTPSKIINGYWETSEISASHGLGSANPGERGNVVIFAHAREGLFLGIKDIKKDDSVYVLTNDKWYRYKVSEVSDVYPSDIKVVMPAGNEELTLFTCSGFFDEKRLIVKALPEN